MAFAAVLGCIMFFARLQGRRILRSSLWSFRCLLGTFMRQTADPSYTIGAAYLGGMNGLRPASPNDPLLPSLIFGSATASSNRRPRRRLLLFHLGLLVASIWASAGLVNSSYGYLLVGCREDLERTETFGYDVG